MVFGDAVVVIALLMVQSANLLQLRAHKADGNDVEGNP